MTILKLLGEMDVKLCGVIIGGGQYSLEMAKVNVQRDSPIVVFKNSGGVANILAYAFENMNQDKATLLSLLQVKKVDEKTQKPKY